MKKYKYTWLWKLDTFPKIIPHCQVIFIGDKVVIINNKYAFNSV